MLAGSLVFAVAGLSCITHVFATYTAVTNIAGEYSMTAVDPGEYRLDASAPGYYPEHRESITINNGANTIPDITLQPMTTPTPVPTDTPTNTPTDTSTPTLIPTLTPTATATNTPTNTPTVCAGSLYSVDNIVGNMRCVPSGSFTQGSPGTEPCRGSDETQFTHNLKRNLAVMENEITRQMWSDLRAVQGTLPVDLSSTTYSPTLSYPVQQNTWFVSVLFANLLSLQNGYTRCYYMDAGFTTPITSSNFTTGPFYCNFTASGYRLPSEGEWEYFTRAGTTTAFSCNETNYTSGNCSSCTSGTHPTLEQYCWYCANSGYVGTQVAGNKLSNPWNLKDVHGNVWEWCWDWYSATYPSPSATDYTGPASGSYRVFRGGGWYANAQNSRSAFRNNFGPYDLYVDLGFRLLRSID